MFVYGDAKRQGNETKESKKGPGCDDRGVRHRLPAALLVALALAIPIAGCGSDSKDSGESATTTVPGGADPADVKVIDAWAKALKAGDVDGAASYWALPSTASNGTPLLQLQTREQVIAFNNALPCGAELVKATTADSGLTTATFDLTNRPGGGCGKGVGGQARTVFKIEDGKIAEWLRAPDPGGTAPSAPGQTV
jgi:limonene-1,2-epoxide hydrolase